MFSDTFFGGVILQMGVIHITHRLMRSCDPSIEAPEPDLSCGQKNLSGRGHKTPKIDENHRNVINMSFFRLKISFIEYFVCL